jgi:glutamyl-tRNA synthetase
VLRKSFLFPLRRATNVPIAAQCPKRSGQSHRYHSMRYSAPQAFIPRYIGSSCEAQFVRSVAVSNRRIRRLPRRPTSLREASSSTPARHLLPDHPARTRFAPSPTGNLHLGSLRTALFNYLLARRTKGQFLLRIEDTDQKRTIPGAERRIYSDLQWAGLQWDEGPTVGGPYGPYRQSERTEIYQDYAGRLLESRSAYRCFCSPERLDTLSRSRHEKGLPLGYDRKCAHLSVDESADRAHKGEGHVVRLRTPDTYPPWYDFVYGNIGTSGKQMPKTLIEDAVYDDPIMIKSDGYPTYHLANVVDDHLMKITHVIRGSEWTTSTPLHIALYKAFGWNPPIFGHVPLLVDEKHQKLSKRNLDTDIATFRDKQGILPDALVNFAVLLGWSHQQKSDVFSLRRLEELFNLKFTKGNTIVSSGKLQFLQKYYARQYIAEGGEQFHQMVKTVCSLLRELCDEKHISTTLGSRRLEDVVGLLLQADSNAYATAEAFALRSASFFDPFPERLSYQSSGSKYWPSSLRVAAASFLLIPDQQWIASVLRDHIAAIKPPAMEAEAESYQTAENAKAWKSEVFRFMRWSLMGRHQGPPIPDLMEIMGRDVCYERIKSAIKRTFEQEQVEHVEQPSVRPFAAVAERDSI